MMHKNENKKALTHLTPYSASAFGFHENSFLYLLSQSANIIEKSFFVSNYGSLEMINRFSISAQITLMYAKLWEPANKLVSF